MLNDTNQSRNAPAALSNGGPAGSATGRSSASIPTSLPPGTSQLPRSSSSISFNNYPGAPTPTSFRTPASNGVPGSSPRRASSNLAGSALHRRGIQQSASAAASTDGSNSVPSAFGPLYNVQRSGQSNNISLHDTLRGSAGGGLTASPRMNNSGSLPPYLQQARAFSPWDPSSSRGAYQLLSSSQQDASGLQVQPIFEENSMLSFSWTIRDAHLLRDEVERTPPPSMGGRSVSAGAGKSDVWTTQPVFGEGKWRVELVRTLRQSDVTGSDATQTASSELEAPSSLAPEPSATQQPSEIDADDNSLGSAGDEPRADGLTVLSVYLTSVMLDYSHSDLEIPASIMIGIRPAREPIGMRGSSSGGWCWRRFYHFCFRREAEYFNTDLPSISELLQDSMIRSDDAFTLTVQLSRGPAHTARTIASDVRSFMPPFETEGAHLMPRSVLDSLRGLLDDANTGDVRIIVRERGLLTADGEGPGRVEPYPVGTSIRQEDGTESWQNNDRVFVRDRVLWAHSSVLKSRSEYFKTMLASNFSEGLDQDYLGGDSLTGPQPSPSADGSVGGRQVRTLRVRDADFCTVYWFLRYLYTEEIAFAEHEDARSAVLDDDWLVGGDLDSEPWDAIGATGAPKRPFLQAWTPLSEIQSSDADELPQSATHQHRGQARHSKDGSGGQHFSTYSGTYRGMQHSTGHQALTSRASDGVLTASPTRAAAAEVPPSSPSLPLSASAAVLQTQQQHGTSSVATQGLMASSDASLSGCEDSHTHPTDPPGKASALSVFRLAHRYNSDLAEVASSHLVTSLTPTSAFPLLLATSVYAELHASVTRFILAHWESVSNSPEMERCCDEVGAGEWGPEAGRALRLFMKSLISPARVVPVPSGRS